MTASFDTCERMMVAVLTTDQIRTFAVTGSLVVSGGVAPDVLDVVDNGGNLWVWPGTHLSHAAFFAARGPQAFAEAGGYPDIELPEPTQIHGRRGDVLLAHYLLGHNIGGNYKTNRIRRAIYCRLRTPGHVARWESCLADPWLEYPGVRRLLNHRSTSGRRA
ncbi:MAG: hypothetical protein ACRDVP_06295 [Acidimicrobiales bacterium]